jgi:hypothetical protein
MYLADELTFTWPPLAGVNDGEWDGAKLLLLSLFVVVLLLGVALAIRLNFLCRYKLINSDELADGWFAGGICCSCCVCCCWLLFTIVGFLVIISIGSESGMRIGKKEDIRIGKSHKVGHFWSGHWHSSNSLSRCRPSLTHIINSLHSILCRKWSKTNSFYSLFLNFAFLKQQQTREREKEQRKTSDDEDDGMLS